MLELQACAHKAWLLLVLSAYFFAAFSKLSPLSNFFELLDFCHFKFFSKFSQFILHLLLVYLLFPEFLHSWFLIIFGRNFYSIFSSETNQAQLCTTIILVRQMPKDHSQFEDCLIYIVNSKTSKVYTVRDSVSRIKWVWDGGMEPDKVAYTSNSSLTGYKVRPSITHTHAHAHTTPLLMCPLVLW